MKLFHREDAMPLPTDFSIYDLGLLPGGTYATPSAVNRNGDVVGVADTKPNLTSNAIAHAFLWERRTRKIIDLHANFASPAFPGDSSRAADINDFGWIVGSASDSSGAEQAFLCKLSPAGFYLPFEALPVPFYSGRPHAGNANAINNQGHVVGRTYEWTGTKLDGPACDAVLWQNGLIMMLARNGEPVSEAMDINEHGQVVGAFTDPGTTRQPFYWSAFTNGLVNLGSLGGGYGKAVSINNAGIVVGESSLQSDEVHGFTYAWSNALSPQSSGLMSDGGPAAPNMSSFQDISDNGETVGVVELASTTHPFAELGDAGGFFDLNALSNLDFRWQLLTGTAISSNAEYIVGTGLFGGERRAWIIEVDRIGGGMPQDFMRPINFGGFAGGTTRTMGYYPHLVIPHIVDPVLGVFRGR